MTKQSLLSELIAQRGTILSFCNALSDAERAKSLTAEGWRVQEFIGHLAYWEQFALDCIRDTFKNGRPALLPESPDDDINGRAAAHRKNWSWQRVRTEFSNTRQALIERVEGLSESDLEFYIPSPWDNDTRIITLETLLREDVLEHGQTHLTDMKRSSVGEHVQ